MIFYHSFAAKKTFLAEAREKHWRRAALWMGLHCLKGNLSSFAFCYPCCTAIQHKVNHIKHLAYTCHSLCCCMQHKKITGCKKAPFTILCYCLSKSHKKLLSAFRIQSPICRKSEKPQKTPLGPNAVCSDLNGAFNSCHLIISLLAGSAFSGQTCVSQGFKTQIILVGRRINLYQVFTRVSTPVIGFPAGCRTAGISHIHAQSIAILFHVKEAIKIGSPAALTRQVLPCSSSVPRGKYCQDII